MRCDELKGKVVAVTGARRGIGRAIAAAFGAQGAVVVDIGRGEADETKALVERAGGTYVHVFCDLSATESVPGAVEEAAERCGTLDVLVNNAGAQIRHPSLEFPLKDWQYILNVNATAVFLACQAAARIMLPKHYGKIVNMASLLSFQGGLTVPAYAASKGAVAQLTKALSNEWAKEGINVNAIAPGYIDTDLNTALIADGVRSRQILERIPAGRWGRPEDIGQTAVFLASGGADYIHGIVLPVDGGWLGR